MPTITSDAALDCTPFGFIVGGGIESFGAGNGDCWLLKTDANGDTLWTRTFGSDSAYFFKTSSDELLPFAGWGLFLSHHSNGESSTGFTFSLHGGLAYLLKEHLSIFPEFSLNLESRDSNSTTTVMLGVGLAGFLY